TVRIGRRNLLDMSDETAGLLIAFAGTEPLLFGGTIRYNVTYSLMRIPPPIPEHIKELYDARPLDESLLSGAIDIYLDERWIDYEAAGVQSAEELDGAILRALAVAGLDEEVYWFGLNGRLGPGTS